MFWSHLNLNKDNLFSIAQIIIYTFAAELLLSAIFFSLGLTISWYFFIICFFLASLFYFCINGGRIYLNIILSLFIIIAFSYLSHFIFDTSCDGNLYHKLAIGLLKNNWNPFETLPSLSIILPGNENSSSTWVECYCKASWIFGASMYALFGNIEAGKSYTIISMICAYMLVYYYMRKKLYNKKISLVIALLSSFNPIACQQLFTFYVDGFLHTNFIILVVSLLMWKNKELFNRKISSCLLASCMIVLGNIKFTGLLYGGIFCIVYYLYDIYIEKNFKNFIRQSLYFLCILVITVFWAGSSSYLTNYMNHGSLVYPLMGKNDVDIMTSNSPFTQKKYIDNLIISLYSRVDNFTYTSGKSTELKIPFTFNKKESDIISSIPDARISGFGVMFGGIITLSIIVIVFAFFYCRNVLLYLNVITCLGMALCIRESWWARYSPYIYMLVIISCYLILSSPKKVLKYFSFVFVITILFNNCLPIKCVKSKVLYAKLLDEDFVKLKNKGEIELSNVEFQGVYFNFIDYDISFKDFDYNNKDNINKFMYFDTLWRDK